MSNPLSQRLKLETSACHCTLDNLPVFRNLISENPKTSEYEVALHYFYHCFSAWQSVFKHGETVFEIPAFARIELHVDALEVEISRFTNEILPPESPPLPVISSQEAYLGYSYVLTGSHLGARFILKNLQTSALSNSYRFDYYLQQDEWGKAHCNWSAWKENLDALANSQAVDATTVIDAATDCFMQLIDWFQLAGSSFDHLRPYEKIEIS